MSDEVWVTAGQWRVLSGMPRDHYGVRCCNLARSVRLGAGCTRSMLLALHKKGLVSYGTTLWHMTDEGRQLVTEFAQAGVTEGGDAARGSVSEANSTRSAEPMRSGDIS